MSPTRHRGSSGSSGKGCVGRSSQSGGGVFQYDEAEPTQHQPCTKPCRDHLRRQEPITGKDQHPKEPKRTNARSLANHSQPELIRYSYSLLTADQSQCLILKHQCHTDSNIHPLISVNQFQFALITS
ncbi:hypothetical protein LDENG_00185030 [Lucifuga dentata]|nr:hypothetical protein LDENG_00185030 [Lucifuga dentata]